jgi:FKBP-type peptidyl-prolyl cis-trans isomerase FkpA
MVRGQRIVTFVILGTILASSACGSDSTPTAATAPSLPTTTFSQTDLVVGTGAEAINGRRLTVHYTLWLYDPARPESKGQQLQTSVGGSPFPFVLGAGGVIRGWDQGVPGMKVGGTRRLIIPPSLAYGASGQGSIPPNATLVFDIQLLDVQ